MLLKVLPMTAAERQRKCRAGGKGRHRGGITPRMKSQGRLEALRKAQAAQQATAAPETPVQLSVSMMAA